MSDSTSEHTEHKSRISRIAHAIGAAGSSISDSAGNIFSLFGGGAILFGETIRVTPDGLLKPQAKTGRRALIFQMARVGVRAVPIVILIQLAIGIIMPLQMFDKLDEFGQAEQIATINAIAAFREMAPLMTAVVLSGFAGASIAAELGTMVTGEEIEALESMALSPVRFLVIPRLLATFLMMIVLTVIADVVMVFGGYLTGTSLGIDPDTFYQLTLEAVDVTSFATGLIKAGIFVLLIGLIACYLGLAVKPWQGSEGVGHATTKTVVYSIVAIIGADAIFTIIFYAYGLFK